MKFIASSQSLDEISSGRVEFQSGGRCNLLISGSLVINDNKDGEIDGEALSVA